MRYYLAPYRSMNTLRRSLDRAVEDLWKGSSNGWDRVHVPLNVVREDDTFVITALVPGLNSEEVDIQVLDDTIAIRGELKSMVDEDTSYLLREIPHGEFRRVIRLPVAIDSEKAEAAIEAGVLSLRVPVAETARPKTIEVKVK